MIEIIGLSILCWMFAEGFRPLQILKQFLHIDEPSGDSISYWIILALNCSLCCGWWFGLIYFQGDLFKAAITSVLAEAISRINKNTMTL